MLQASFSTELGKDAERQPLEGSFLKVNRFSFLSVIVITHVTGYCIESGTAVILPAAVTRPGRGYFSEYNFPA